MPETLCVVLGGGQGARLFPLTEHRSKPAVPLGGKYRLIDIPVSNCLNSDLGKIYVLTQFNSVSLHRHIERTYRFDNFSQNFVEILAAMQTSELQGWYQGTADAVRKNLRYIDLPDYDRVLILSGDQLYRMDFRNMLSWHKKNKADLTIAVIPVEKKKAREFGILQIDEECFFRRFVEKPQEDDLLDELAMDEKQLHNLNIESPNSTHLASMGIYLFNREVLVELLDNDHTDFGREIIPKAIERKKALAFPFKGYWEDIGTIQAFYKANLDLTKTTPKFDFYSKANPIYSRPRQLPASRIFKCEVEQSAIADGCIIDKSEIHHCIIGIRSMIRHQTKLRNTIIMGADFYENPADKEENSRKNIPDVGIGSDTEIQDAIIDKNARIGEGTRIMNKERVQEADGDCYYIRDGIVIISKNAVVPPGKTI